MYRTMIAAAFTAFLGVAPPSSPFDALWRLFSSFWTGADIGCGWDPYGGCRPVQKADKAGCGWDPDGRCAPVQDTRPKAGCGWDPYGGCAPIQNATAMEGCGWDPDGRCGATP